MGTLTFDAVPEGTKHYAVYLETVSSNEGIMVAPSTLPVVLDLEDSFEYTVRLVLRDVNDPAAAVVETAQTIQGTTILNISDQLVYPT